MVSGSVRTFLGIAAAAAGRPDDAVRELRLGIAADDRAGTPPFAALLHISERTAESHVQHILGKLGLANRTHIASWARDGLRTDQP